MFIQGLLTAALALSVSHPAASRASASRKASLIGSATMAANDSAFSSLDEYLGHLASEAALPEGFRIGNCGFEFEPSEAATGTRVKMRLTLIVADKPSSSFAAVFTKNAFCGSPVTVGKRRMRESPTLQALLVNNKVSNVCAAGDGVADSEALCEALATALELPDGAASVLPSSTGVIGWKLPVPEMRAAMPEAVASLQAGSALPAAQGIMTTDRYPKLRAASVCGGRIVGIAKGAGDSARCESLP
eukprot:3275393-Pleurochrysis_carterae.AAC.1